MSSFYYRSFARAAILPYVGGTVLHMLRLVFRFPLSQTPPFIHGIIVLLAGYAAMGFILYAGRIPFRGWGDKVLYGLVIFHLGGSAIMHGFSLLTGSNDWMTVFSPGYSYFAIAYFAGLGLYCAGLARRISRR